MRTITVFAGLPMDPLNRRLFLKRTAAAAAVTAGGNRLASAVEPDAASVVPGKDPRLIVHAPQPPVFETPLELLSGQQVTPVAQLFVRNCQQPPRLTAKDPLAAWKLELAGLVNRPQAIDARMLRKLPQEQVEMVVQCSGNSRKLFSESAKTEGTQWGRGAMGNVEFGGVPLAQLLNHLGIKASRSARYLTAEGRDDPKPGEMDFEHSIPLDEALEKSILALDLNGSPLPVIHGGPLRLVTPGYYGTMHVKWVTRLRFEDRESNHTSHIPRYRTPLVPIEPGQKFDPTLENSEPNWRMKLKSVVLLPAPGARLATGDVKIDGVAFNDGAARIESVLVSIDEGRSWQQAELDVPHSPYAWYRFHANAKLSPGKHQIWSRAVDALGRSQPLDGSIYWNPRGYTWNGVDKIDVTVG